MAITTIKEFGEKILEGVNADIDDLPKGSMAAWFGAAGSGVTYFRHGETMPIEQYSRIVGIFQGDNDIRVYTICVDPKSAGLETPAGWKTQPPRRYTFTKTAPTYVAEVMSLETMADEIIEEWNELADDDDDEPGEFEAITEYIGGLDTLLDRDRLLADLNDGAHHPDDEGDDGEEDTITVETPKPNPDATATVNGPGPTPPTVTPA